MHRYIYLSDAAVAKKRAKICKYEIGLQDSSDRTSLRMQEMFTLNESLCMRG